MARLGCIADDITGATDLAGALVDRGVRTIQVLGVPDEPLAQDVDAVVVALKTRTMPAGRACEQVRRSARWLREQGVSAVFSKYCSTFDSTAAGNIGPITDTLLDALDVPATVHCPSYPATGRTVFQGHLFVGRELLSESGMQHHPLTPMTDANLVRVLQAQTPRPVELLALTGPGERGERLEQLLRGGAVHVVADAVTDEDVDDLARAVRDHRLVAGGAALGAAFGAVLVDAPGDSTSGVDVPAGYEAVLVGSASSATIAQVEAFERAHPVARFTAEQLVEAGTVASLLSWAETRLADGPVLLAVDSRPAAVVRAQQALGPETASQLIENALGDLARGLRERGVGRLVVAGGESSGAVAHALGISQVRIGASICPGVPWTVSEHPRLAVAFKSGNFGGPEFFTDAFATLDTMHVR